MKNINIKYQNPFQNCWRKLCSALSPSDWESGKLDKKVSLNTIEGFMIGPNSMTFKRLLQTHQNLNQKLEQWQYISLITSKQQTLSHMLTSIIEIDTFTGITRAYAALIGKLSEFAKF